MKQKAETSHQPLGETASVFCQQLPSSQRSTFWQSYLYHQVLIRKKENGLKWVMVLRDIRPYKGM